MTLLAVDSRCWAASMSATLIFGSTRIGVEFRKISPLIDGCPSPLRVTTGSIRSYVCHSFCYKTSSQGGRNTELVVDKNTTETWGFLGKGSGYNHSSR